MVMGVVLVGCGQGKVVDDNSINLQESAVFYSKKKINSSLKGSETDKYLHENPPVIFDSGLKVHTYKYFRILKDCKYQIDSISFWDNEKEKYLHGIKVGEITPYKAIVKNPLIHVFETETNFDFGTYDLRKFSNLDTFISKKYPPNYTDDWVVYAGKQTVGHEDISQRFDKELLAIVFSFEVYNKAGYTLGIKSTVVVFNKVGGIVNSLDFDTPIFDLATNNSGEYLAYFIGGEFGGEMLATIYPTAVRVFNIDSQSFILSSEDYAGDPLGGGCTDERFFFSFGTSEGIRDIVIDLKKKKYWEKIFSKDEYNKMEYRIDGYYYKKTGQAAYLFERDFITKKF